MKKVIGKILVVSLLFFFGIAHAGIVVIVHPSSSVDSLTKDDVARIFLGKTQEFPGGGLAVPINQDDKLPVRDTFNEVVCKKSRSQYKSYWSRLVFTGKGRPPKDSGGDADVKALVAQNPDMVGYVDSSVLDDSVKAVYTLP